MYGRSFRLKTDSGSLVWLHRRDEPSGQVARWLEILAEFPFEISPQKKSQLEALAQLWRLPRCTERKQCERIENRDRSPTRQELDREVPLLIDKVAVYNPHAKANMKEAQSEVCHAVSQMN